MLFYSGKTKSLGEVHHGTTVTDYLTQERERGITICSSAVAFNWKDYRINLLDTPGRHANNQTPLQFISFRSY